MPSGVYGDMICALFYFRLKFYDVGEHELSFYSFFKFKMKLFLLGDFLRLSCKSYLDQSDIFLSSLFESPLLLEEYAPNLHLSFGVVFLLHYSNFS